MYLQITTRCNMACGHCCYSCAPNKGKHMDYSIFEAAVSWINHHEGEDCYISIGGGEPTLHPRFFDIIERCLKKFESVWLATNGSKEQTMRRLANIMDNEDHMAHMDNLSQDDYIDEDEWLDACYEDTISNHDDKLCVALSTDYHHDNSLVSNWVKSYWKSRASKSWDKATNFQLRDVTNTPDGVSSSGRAKWNQMAYSNHCVCPSLFINPYGKIKPCGCTSSPIIGNVHTGIEDKWQSMLMDEDYTDSQCYTTYKRS